MLSEDKKTLYIYSKKPTAKEYSIFLQFSFPTAVNGVITCDFDLDGNLDFLVTFKLADRQFSHEIYFGNRRMFYKGSALLPQTRHHFTLLDYFGDLKPTLLAANTQGQNIIVKNIKDSAVEVESVAGFCEIADNHSNAFIDLNGDCMADLVLTCIATQPIPDIGIAANEKYLEIWLNSSTGFQVFSKRKILPAGAGAISFTDFDGDGGVDILFPVCDPPGSCTTENSIHIFFNQKKSICDEKECLPRSQICEAADVSFDFNFNNVRNESADHLIANVKNIAQADMKLVIENPLFGSQIPIRFGDFNQDSYTDVLVSLQPFLQVGQLASSFVRLFENVPCKDSICTSAQTKSKRRTLKLVDSDHVPCLAALSGAIEAAFVDTNGDAKTDIVVNSWNPSTTNPLLNVCQNYFYQDAFSLSALTVLPKAWTSNKAYGSPLPGVVYFYDVVDLDEGHRVRQGNQLSQVAYNSLQLPYVLMGLGRVNNFLDKFIVSVPSRSVRYHLIFRLPPIL